MRVGAHGAGPEVRSPSLKREAEPPASDFIRTPLLVYLRRCTITLRAVPCTVHRYGCHLDRAYAAEW